MEKPKDAKLTGVGSSRDMSWLTVEAEGEHFIVRLSELDKVLLRKHVEKRGAA